jgi:hypothetical protein
MVSPVRTAVSSVNMSAFAQVELRVANSEVKAGISGTGMAA